ncbi:hypothetical protein GQ44DRAFT_770812 [Phaeosphaeriaceae sp. PMI808]|nr:hypothetical protein GQ44DRAFT_770812 [Phaeosphaeriaceae sp. PMI808]
MKFTSQIFAFITLFTVAFAAPLESNTIEVRDASTGAIIPGLMVDKRQVCYCYGGTCTPGCYGKA